MALDPVSRDKIAENALARFVQRALTEWKYGQDILTEEVLARLPSAEPDLEPELFHILDRITEKVERRVRVG